MGGLWQDNVHYEKCCNVYRKFSRRYDQWMQWIEVMFNDNILNKLTESVSEDECLTMLGIGCSTGKLKLDMTITLLREAEQVSKAVFCW